MAYQKTKYLLKKEGLAAKKKLGQNFLVHEHTATRIVELAGLHPEDTVVEVGVGLGALTRPLAARVRQVIGLEADSGIIRYHQQQQDLPDNVVLRHQDVLKADFQQIALETGGRLKIIANLPYSISSPFLFKLIDASQAIDQVVVMVQKEVAMRLMADPGTKEYGVPSVILASCATVAPLLKVGPAEFHPRPKVDSTVIRISFVPEPERVRALGDFDRRLLRRVVNAAFGQRRKTLSNSLHAAAFFKDKETLRHCIASAGISPSVRAETLDLEAFVALSRTIANGLHNNPDAT